MCHTTAGVTVTSPRMVKARATTSPKKTNTKSFLMGFISHSHHFSGPVYHKIGFSEMEQDENTERRKGIILCKTKRTGNRNIKTEK